MDRLKKEWLETQIPPEVRLRAKNRAWEKIQHPVFRMRTVATAFTACVVALAVVFAIFRNVPEERMTPVQTVATENLLPVYGGVDDVTGSVDDVASAWDIGDTGDPVSIDVADIANTADVDSVAIVANIASPDNIGDADGAVASNDIAANDVEPASNDAPERVVLNFILPESGARLIWIVNSNI